MEQTNNQEEQNLKEFNPCLELLKLFNLNPKSMINLLLDIITILHIYPPAKHENKFIYGKSGEKRLIRWINENIECLELDKTKKNGSEYKNDCEIKFPEDNKIQFSIKISKSGDSVTLINKNNKTEHSVIGCYMLIVHIKKERIYCFQHNEYLEKYINDDHAAIKYRSSVFTYLDKDKNNYYQFPESEKIEQLKKNLESETIEKDIYEIISNEIEKRNRHLYEQ